MKVIFFNTILFFIFFRGIFMDNEIDIGYYMCINCSNIGCQQDDETFNKCLKEFEKEIEEDIKHLSKL